MKKLSLCITILLLLPLMSIGQNNILINSAGAGIQTSILRLSSGGTNPPVVVGPLSTANIANADVIFSGWTPAAFTAQQIADLSQALLDGKRIIVTNDGCCGSLTNNGNALLAALGSSMSSNANSIGGCASHPVTITPHPLTAGLTNSFTNWIFGSINVGSGTALIQSTSFPGNPVMLAIEDVSNGEVLLTTDVNVYGDACLAPAADFDQYIMNLLNVPVGPPPPPAVIPTMGEWGLIILAMLMLTAGTLFIRRRYALSLKKA